MKHGKYIVTGINKLTGERVALSLPMSREDAEKCLQRERENRRSHRSMPYIRLRVERQQPIQLTLNFEPHETKI